MKQPYKTWNKEDFARHILNQYRFYKLDLIDNGGYLLSMVEDAINDQNWNFLLDFDGCTIVQDNDHPSIACFLHDYHWIMGYGGKISNRIFYKLMLLTWISPYESKRRLLGVKLGWGLYYKWHHLLKRNMKVIKNNILEFDNNISNKSKDEIIEFVKKVKKMKEKEVNK